MFWTLEYRLRRTQEAAAYHAGKVSALTELIENSSRHTSFERDALVEARAKQCSCEERVRQLREQIAARKS